MRQYLILFGLLFLAACASSGPKGPAVPQSMLDRAQSMSKDETVDYIANLAEDRLKDICRTQRTIRGQADCVREAILRGFDETGEAARHCDFDKSFEGGMKCVIFGASSYELALHEALPVAEDYDWEDSEGTTKAMLEQLKEKLVRACLSSGLDGADKCVLSRIGQAFQLAETQIDLCTDPADTKHSIDCLVRSYMLQRFGTAIDKMGAGQGQEVQRAGPVYQFARLTSLALRRAITSAGVAREHIR